MKIILEGQEVFDVLHSALCNGLRGMYNYGFTYTSESDDYDNARKTLVGKGLDFICIEDVYLQIIKDGGKLMFHDEEDNLNYYLGYDKVKVNMNKVNADDILSVLKGTDDGLTADIILQTLIFGEVVYG